MQRPDLVIGWWAIPTVLEGGTAEQVAQFVPPTLRGDLVWCQLFSQAGGRLGSGGAADQSRTRRRVEAHRAEGVDLGGTPQGRLGRLPLARTDPNAPKHKGITYFLVDMRSPGIDIRPLREITGDELFNEVFFDEVFVPDEMVVGDVNDGWRLARTTLASERVAMAHGTSLGNPMEEMRALRSEGIDPALAVRLGLTARRSGRLAAGPPDRATRGRWPGQRRGQRSQAHRGALPAGARGVPDGAVPGGGLIDNGAVQELPEHPVPVDRRSRRRQDPADDGRRATARPAALTARPASAWKPSSH